MASVRVQSVVLGASLGLGVLNLVWLDLALAPHVLASTDAASSSVAPTPASAPAVVVAPARAVVVEPPAPAAPLVTLASEQVYFASTSAALDDTARACLQGIVEHADAGATFLLEGHADRRGEHDFNFELGRRRAEAVRDHLGELGVARARIRAVSHGEMQAGARDALWRDRRVEIQITGGSR